MLPSANDVTALLQSWNAGDESALQKLAPLVYEELHRSARHCMAGERSNHTLQATALINEVYLRLIQIKHVSWQNHAHFLAACAQLMRRILVDSARSRNYLKRGGQVSHTSFDENVDYTLTGSTAMSNADLVALDDALKTLASVDERKSRVVELRFFGGLSVQETAEVLDVSSETVMRDWRLAKVWLLRELSAGSPAGTGQTTPRHKP